jgi:hypothetical protein
LLRLLIAASGTTRTFRNVRSAAAFGVIRTSASDCRTIGLCCNRSRSVPADLARLHVERKLLRARPGRAGRDRQAGERDISVGAGRRADRSACTAGAAGVRMTIHEGETMSTSTDTVRTIEDLQCLRCEDPRGADLRHALAQTGGSIDERQCSPTSGLPFGCCKIRSTPVHLQRD